MSDSEVKLKDDIKVLLRYCKNCSTTMDKDDYLAYQRVWDFAYED